jgi:hypothetical protein
MTSSASTLVVSTSLESVMFGRLVATSHTSVLTLTLNLIALCLVLRERVRGRDLPPLGE